jgi:hypothetical protein
MIPSLNCYDFTMIRRTLRSALAAVTMIVLSVGTAPGSEATGSIVRKKPKKPAPTLLDRKSRELSPAALGMDPGKSRGYEPGGDTSGLKRPGEFRFGDNTLHVDADKKDPTPPPGLEANGQAVLNKAPSEPLLQPSYFGLRLTTPLR